MKFDSFISKLYAFAKHTVVAVVCAMLLLTSAAPAMASSSPSQGLESLDQIQQKADESISDQSEPTAKIQSDTSGGLNRVQGTADKEKMHTPENAENTDTVENLAKDFMNKITGDD